MDSDVFKFETHFDVNVVHPPTIIINEMRTGQPMLSSVDDRALPPNQETRVVLLYHLCR